MEASLLTSLAYFIALKIIVLFVRRKEAQVAGYILGLHSLSL